MLGVLPGSYLDIEEIGRGHISGFVAGPSGHPATSAKISVVPAVVDRTRTSYFTYNAGLLPTSNGSYEVAVLAGQYKVTASAPGYADASAMTTVEAKEFSTVNLTLGAGTTIVGQVLNDGRPAAYCVVGKGLLSNSSGAFELQGYSDGAFEIAVRCPDGAAGAAHVTIQDGVVSPSDVRMMSTRPGPSR